jgi:hypothetical protein
VSGVGFNICYKNYYYEKEKEKKNKPKGIHLIPIKCVHLEEPSIERESWS